MYPSPQEQDVPRPASLVHGSDSGPDEREGSVAHCDYRPDCLEPNGLFILSPNNPLPPAVAAQVRALAQTEPQTAVLRPDEAAETVRWLEEVQDSEPEVVRCLQQHVFRAPGAVVRYESLVVANRAIVPHHLLPRRSIAPLPVAQPQPTMLYG